MLHSILLTLPIQFQLDDFWSMPLLRYQDQSNALVIGCIMIAISMVRLQWWNIAAIATAIAFAWKLYPIAVGMLLVLVAPAQMGWRLIFALLGVVLFPFLCQDPSYVLEQYQLWYSTRAQDNRLYYPLDVAPLDLWYLLVRVGNIAISEFSYRILQLVSGVAIAGFCILGRLQRWPQERLLGGIFSFVCVWMVLCGPSTERDTYLIIAPAIVIGAIESLTMSLPTITRLFGFLAYLLLLLAAIYWGLFLHQFQFPICYMLQPLSVLFFLGYGILRYGFWSEQPASDLLDKENENVSVAICPLNEL